MSDKSPRPCSACAGEGFGHASPRPRLCDVACRRAAQHPLPLTAAGEEHPKQTCAGTAQDGHQCFHPCGFLCLHSRNPALNRTQRSCKSLCAGTQYRGAVAAWPWQPHLLINKDAPTDSPLAAAPGPQRQAHSTARSVKYSMAAFLKNNTQIQFLCCPALPLGFRTVPNERRVRLSAWPSSGHAPARGIQGVSVPVYACMCWE